MITRADVRKTDLSSGVPGATGGPLLPASGPSPYTLARALLPVLLLTTFAFAPILHAEELTAEQEAAIMAEEAKVEAELPMDKQPPPSLEGRVHLSGDAVDEADTVVGMFVVKERAYQLRLGAQGVLKQLKPFDGKPITLIGSIRMRGKYFIVDGVDVPAPGPPAVDRSRRMSM